MLGAPRFLPRTRPGARIGRANACFRAKNSRNPAPKTRLSQTAWYLDVPHGVQKQSCWLRACERSASVPESSVYSKRGLRRAPRRFITTVSPACPRGRERDARRSTRHHFIRRPRQEQQHGRTPWRRQRRGPRRPRRLRPRQRRPRARARPRPRTRTRRRRQG